MSKYMVRWRKPPSQTWRTFLENHAKQLVSIDFRLGQRIPRTNLKVGPFLITVTVKSPSSSLRL